MSLSHAFYNYLVIFVLMNLPKVISEFIGCNVFIEFWKETME